MLNIDLRTATRLVEESIKERGEEYVYEAPAYGCAYVASRYDEDVASEVATGPSCLVGAALIRGGIDPQWFIDECCNEGPVLDVLEALAHQGLATYDPGAEGYLQRVQYSQDNGAAWGEAHRRALKGQKFRKVGDVGSWVYEMDNTVE